MIIGELLSELFKTNGSADAGDNWQIRDDVAVLICDPLNVVARVLIRIGLVDLFECFKVHILLFFTSFCCGKKKDLKLKG